MSRIKAECIGEKTGVIPARLGEVVSRDLQVFSKHTLCPLLKKRVCSIYEYRPLICRVYVSLDVDDYWCRFENWHKLGDFVPKPTFNAYAELRQKSGSAGADIRDYFSAVPN